MTKKNTAEKADQNKENPDEPQCHRRKNSNFISKLLVCWVWPLFLIGSKRELDLSDFDVTYTEDKAETLRSKFTAEWARELLRKKPNLLKAILRSLWKELSVAFLFLCISGIGLRVGIPIILAIILRDFEQEEVKYKMAALFVTFTFLLTLSNHPAILLFAHTVAKIRIGLTSLLYQKVLRLNHSSISASGVGQATNLVTNDLGRLDRSAESLAYVFIIPVQAAVGLAYLWQTVGLALVPAAAIMVILGIYQASLGRLFAKLRRKIALQSDKRIRFLTELVNALQLIKLLTCEQLYEESISQIRKQEISLVKRKSIFQAVNVTIFEISTKVDVLLTLLIYIILRESITVEVVFLVLSMYNVLAIGIGIQFPNGTALMAELLTSFKRIQEFLLLEEYVPLATRHHEIRVGPDENEIKVRVDDLSVGWSDSTQPVFDSVTFTGKCGELIGVVGPVGSGKSSLLLALLSELEPRSGSVRLQGSTAYASQEAWLLPETVRENILFGMDYDATWYKRVVDACALTTDFNSFPFGDQTIVGDKGTNLSGGQKARINLARACYSKADIYLLDDPLSAVDVNVAKHLVDHCIRGLLKDKCVILVTHQTHVFERSDKVIRLGPTLEVSSDADVTEKHDLEPTIDELFESDPDPSSTIPTVVQSVDYNTLSAGKPCAEKELRSIGFIKGKVFWEYLTAGNSWWSLFCTFVFLAVTQACMSGSDVWLKKWCDIETDEYKFVLSMQNLKMTASLAYHLDYIGIYGLILLFALVFGTARAMCLNLGLINSSKALHAKLTQTILRVPMRFVEVNTSGQILNRFILDIGTMDEYLPFRGGILSTLTFQVFGSCAVVCIANPMMVFPTILLLGLCFILLRIYLPGSANIRRMDGIYRSPLLTQINSTLTGIATIRAFRKQEFCSQKFDISQNKHTSVFNTYLYTLRGYTIAIELVADVYTLIVVVALTLTTTSASTFGLAASSLFLLSYHLMCVAQFSDVLTQMTSAERVIEYTKVKTEAPLRALGRDKPANDWPTQGGIRFDDLSVRYENGPLVLRNLNLEIKPREKVGIIGRTGAGKSSLVGALFRLVEKDCGWIQIDSLDTSTVGLHDLREKISIIPQNPFVFSGTVRRALDPFGKYTDADIWNSLEAVQLQGRLQGMAAGLDSAVEDGGANFSQGERQLLCIARTILLKSKIVILDEATSNIDSHTDKLIQDVIRERYRDCTVLIIAHRLDTVMDTDKILVLDAGSVVEFDEPFQLLQNPNSYLFRLVQKTGSKNAQKLIQKAIKRN